jgi:hypothetical protein
MNNTGNPHSPDRINALPAPLGACAPTVLGMTRPAIIRVISRSSAGWSGRHI